MNFEPLRAQQAVLSSGSLRIDPASKQVLSPQLHEEKLSRFVVQDTVEISEAGRKLAEGAIVSHAAKYFGTTQINDALNRVLEDQPEEVSNAVYNMIQSNFIVDGTVTDEKQRAVLLEMGVSQSKYIADRYMEGDKAKEFMKTMNQIAGIALTRTMDSETGDISYTTPADRPIGAPEDYVKLSEVMKQVDPQKYTAFMNDIKGGGNGLSQLLSFAQKVPQNPDWINKYKERTEQTEELLNKPQLTNQFDKADTSSASAFMNSMQNLLKESSPAQDSYMQNMRGFFRNLGVQVD
ncbi:hypothetical protein [Paenibacillus polymyxa]|uniref:Uncharacterized protein n=1 Tax=Paenibacillus polymyxa (strain SC2) TaxID=886882 RepID=E3E5D9_PAEPS|nr:hypothetical protein [Paenibacillus polymyxa]ADO57658.1 hypothetical protein PPSC2_17310 [Paenibacillus polymyxa SC2]WPQ55407.1 hypothetical protein SKN87_17630 [Paenibacillus polymyxa]CCI70301.1 hypothetical protein PPM_3492 [Paenibacillus polymyxa M1]